MTAVTWPAVGWLLLQTAALWPHWRWALARGTDGSDDPLGLAALAALLALAVRLGPQLLVRPRAGWAALAAAATLAATAAHFAAPPLLGALLAALALSAGWRSHLPAGLPLLPATGLAVLALPVLSSLQFYAGFPLRIATAQLSTWALQLGGLAAERTGTAMLVQGRLVIVDAPCSGVQMVWMAYFCACAAAAWSGLSDRRFLRRLPWVGLLVLGGNVVRNSVLVSMEATQAHVREAIHHGVGLLVLAVVCAAVLAIVRGGRDARA